MLSMYSNRIIDQKVIEGLYNVSEQIDDIGSEIACVIRYN